MLTKASFLPVRWNAMHIEKVCQMMVSCTRQKDYVACLIGIETAGHVKGMLHILNECDEQKEGLE